MKNNKNVPGCSDAVKQITNIPTGIAIHKSIQNAPTGVVVKFSIDQRQYFLAKSHRDHV
jgi:hypothetical protein